MKVFVTDENGIYIYATEAESTDDNSFKEEPLEAKEGYAIVREGDSWVYKEDHRADILFDKSTGLFQQFNGLGPIPDELTNIPRPDKYHTWSDKDNGWVLTKEAQEQQLVDAKNSKIAEINATADIVISKASKSYEVASNELASWSDQAQEAIAWHDDNSTPCPLLNGIASARGVPFEILAAKAYEKAIAYKMLMGGVVGLTQRYRDLVTQAKTLEELGFTIDFKKVTG